jgi:hypothetical protein
MRPISISCEQNRNHHNKFRKNNSNQTRGCHVSRAERYWRAAAQPIRNPLPALLVLPSSTQRTQDSVAVAKRHCASARGPAWKWKRGPLLKTMDHCMYSTVHCTEQEQIHFHHTGYGRSGMKSRHPWLVLAPPPSGTSDQCCHGHCTAGRAAQPVIR